MRVVIAPDKFAGTLRAGEAARAVAAGWRAADPDAELDLIAMSDGGPGFVAAIHQAVGGRLVARRVPGPLGGEVPAELLLGDDPAGRGRPVRGPTAYLEVAQACGLDLVPAAERDPARATSYGVGVMIAAAVDEGAARIVIGLGGSATNDGGAGMLAALGARPAERLRQGGLALGDLDRVEPAPARARVAGVELVAATDVDNPLLGPYGASRVFGPQKGAGSRLVTALDAALARWAECCDPALAGQPGAGAAGGLGYALLLLGARRESGVTAVARAVRLADRIAAADLVVTGEGAFDEQSLRGKAPYGVAELAREHGVPCVVVAGVVEVTERRLAQAGIAEAYALVDEAGSVAAARAAAADHLAALAARIARRWSGRTGGRLDVRP